MPEKKRMNVKCTKLSMECEFVLRMVLTFLPPLPFSFFADPFTWPLACPLAFPLLFSVIPLAVCFSAVGSVSGKLAHKYNVSVTISISENPAAVANGFAAKVVIFASAAPSAGPNVNAMLKQAPTSAIVAPLCSSLEISVAIAVANCTFPSLKPPTILLARNVLKSTARTHNATERILPIILHSNAVLLPYLSDNVPMIGDAIA